MTLVVCLLGSVTCVADGLERPVASAAQRRLLAMLAIEMGSVVPIDRLADQMGVSNSGVRTAISRLRHTLGADRVRREPPGYRIHDIERDVDHVHGLLDQARSVAAPQRLDLLEAAHEIRHGPALVEFAAEDWAVGAALGYTELCAAVAEERIDAFVAADRVADAVAALATHIQMYPFRERPRLVLMDVLARTGRSVEAMRAARRFRSLLREEIGSMPSHHFQELEQAILADGLDAPH